METVGVDKQPCRSRFSNYPMVPVGQPLKVDLLQAREVVPRPQVDGKPRDQRRTRFCLQAFDRWTKSQNTWRENDSRFTKRINLWPIRKKQQECSERQMTLKRKILRWSPPYWGSPRVILCYRVLRRAELGLNRLAKKLTINKTTVTSRLRRNVRWNIRIRKVINFEVKNS